jgi:hypothetical protein
VSKTGSRIPVISGSNGDRRTRKIWLDLSDFKESLHSPLMNWPGEYSWT